MDTASNIKQLEEEKNVKELLNIICDPGRPNEKAEEALIRIGDFATDELIKRIEDNLKKQNTAYFENYDRWKSSTSGILCLSNETYGSDIIAEILGEIRNLKAINYLIKLIEKGSPPAVRESAGNALIKLNAAVYNKRKCVLEIIIPQDYEGIDKTIRYELMCPHCNRSETIDIKDEYFDIFLGKDSDLTMADGIGKRCQNCNKDFDWVDGNIINYIQQSPKKRWWKVRK